jgi:ATP-dependent DNA helicase DinG
VSDESPPATDAAAAREGAGTVRELLHAAVAALGGVERPGQVRMAERVAAAVESGEHLLVQAGTGTGKSVAYLVPALAHGDRVVVATATIALQRQLIERDLPRTVTALADRLDRKPAFAMLKGRGNYLCLHRLHEGVPDEQETLFAPSPSSRLGAEVMRLREWAGETETGDRDELVPGVGERAWGQVSVSSRECLGAARCPYGDECFAELARERAREADVVVTNHALLAIDAIEGLAVLPEHDVVIVDEAHELVGRVTGVATEELTAGMVERAAKRCGRQVDDYVADDLLAAGEALGEALAAARPGRLHRLPEDLGLALSAVRDAARAAVSALSGSRDRGVTEEDAARRRALAAVESAYGTAERVLEGSEYDVVWVSGSERWGPSLHVAPLTVSGLLREKLFGRRTVVLTSATLKLGGDFDGVARSMGLLPSRAELAAEQAEKRRAGIPDRHEEPARDHVPAGAEGPGLGERPASRDGRGLGEDRAPDDRPAPGESPSSGEGPAWPVWHGVDVGSPFDYRSQSILYVARHLPPPGRDGIPPAVLDELAGLLEAAGGRALGLFSSMRAAQAATEAMRDRLGLRVLCQGEDSLGTLLRTFAAEERTCLFGTLSLWQGVDVPGSACQLVVVDRIPFPRPDDPLSAARQQAVDAAGGNGFMAVAASHAALLLAQGAGRLIRSATDRGVVAVLDPRLASARYAGFLRASLPDFWYTTDPAQVRRSLAAIDAAAPPPHPVG